MFRHLVFVLAALQGLSCSSVHVSAEDSGSADDSGTASDALADVSCAIAPGNACSLVPQCGCTGDLGCIPLSDHRTVCSAVGPQGANSQCTKQSDCGKGLLCINGLQVCLPFCTGPSDCAGTCEGTGGISACVGPCDPLVGCGTVGTSCVFTGPYPAGSTKLQTGCVSAAAKGVGEPCVGAG